MLPIKSFKVLFKNTPYIRKMYKGIKFKEKGEVTGCQIGSK
jgi:hypothetical protein